MKENTFNFLGKLYVWSIVFEPLLFFLVVGQRISGIGANVGRLLQILVIILLVLTTLIRKKQSVTIPNPFHRHFRWYFAYFGFLILSAIYGVIEGAYDINIGTVSFDLKRASLFSRFISSPWIRPLFEYFIVLYYFIYFVVLSQYLLNSRKAIDYFFKAFFAMFFLSLFLGVIDYLLVLLFNYEWIPRHLSDFIHVGLRFHGLAGEPRDAFVYLMFGICLIFLKEKWTGKFKGKRFWFLIIILASLATQSASGLVGLFLALALMVVYLLPKLPIKYFLPSVAILSIITAVLVNAVMISPRILVYIENLPAVLAALQLNTGLPGVLKGQIVNFYPIFLRLENLMEVNLIPLFTGTGLGTASIANSFFFAGEEGVFNPHANIIRIAFEGGAIGLLLFVAAFTRPLKYLKLSKQNYNQLMLFMLLILGVNLGHRSSTLYIFLGLALLIFNYKNNHEVKKI